MAKQDGLKKPAPPTVATQPAITPKEESRQKFAAAVKDDGGHEVAAARLKCSVSQVSNIIGGKRDVGLRIARAIEEVYGIPMENWLEELPASRKLA